jgi:glycosyltransferase involved in cell wall biosynthesis
MSGLTFLEVTGLTSRKYGGGERAFMALAKQASERGHQLHILWEGAPTSDAVVRDLAAAGAVSHIYKSSGRPWQALVHITRLIRELDVDVVHAHYQPAMTSGLIAARITGRPSLLTIHQILAPHPTYGRLRKRAKVYARARTTLATMTEAVSLAARRAYVERGLADERMVLHYMGIEPPKAQRTRSAVRKDLGIGRSRIVVACTAFHGHVKGVDILLYAFAKAQAVRPDLFLLQIGGDLVQAQTEAVHKLATELGLDDHMLWAGLRDEVSDLLGASDLYVQPSRDEGLGLALAEAACSKLACIGSDTGGIPEVITHGETGLLVPSEDVDALAQAILKLADDKPLRKKLAAAAQKSGLERFDLHRQTAIQLDRYEALAAGR